jgi:ribosome-associated toxin RatA of RatAB toxin-antitoxin module
MKQVKKSILVWYSPHEMYSLVTAVEDYPQFLPWCNKAEVLARDEHSMTARLGLQFAGVRHAFTTRNHHDPDRSVRVELIDGPFSELEGSWQFGALGRPGSDGQACKIEFDLRYAFAGVTLEMLISPVFDRVANTLVDAFVKRAEAVYGPR